MTILLDENFPLGLVRVLEADGLHVEHIITLGWRGASDTRIRTRLSSPEVLFLTQDEDFLFGEAVASTSWCRVSVKRDGSQSGLNSGAEPSENSCEHLTPRGCSN